MDRRLIIASAIVATCISMYKVKGACFYTDYNYQGEKVCGEGNVILHGGPYEYKFKSLKLDHQGSFETVTVFSESLHGVAATTIRDTPDLSNIHMNGKVSSYITFRSVCFYKATHFVGLPYCSIAGKSAIDPTWRNKIVSARVPKGYQVVIYDSVDFTGNSATLGPGNYATLEAFAIDVHSIIVTPAYTNISMYH